MGFENEKKNCLNKLDRSKKGFIDEEIKELVELINSSEKYYTTSSCSGRIVLLKGLKKNRCEWLFVSHKEAELNDIKSACLSGEVWLREEGMILHVCCRTLDDAQKLVDICRSVGFRRTGVQSLKKLAVEVGSSDCVDVLIAKNGRILADDNYLRILVEEANKKLRINLEKIEKLKIEIKPILK